MVVLEDIRASCDRVLSSAVGRRSSPLRQPVIKTVFSSVILRPKKGRYSSSSIGKSRGVLVQASARRRGQRRADAQKLIVITSGVSVWAIGTAALPQPRFRIAFAAATRALSFLPCSTIRSALAAQSGYVGGPSPGFLQSPAAFHPDCQTALSQRDARALSSLTSPLISRCSEHERHSIHSILPELTKGRKIIVSLIASGTRLNDRPRRCYQRLADHD
jgi:hypothetical protein